MGVISEAKAAVELAKELGSYLKQAGEHDPKLMGMFEDLRGKVLSLYESDIELRQQVRELEEKLKLREEVSFDREVGAYFKGTNEEPGDGPFCAKCFHEDKGLVPMAEEISSIFDEYGTEIFFNVWQCPVCQKKIRRKE